MAREHNEFIRDTEELFAYNILPHIQLNSYQTVYNDYSTYKEKWKKIFSLKKEETIDETINKEKGKLLKLYVNLKKSINFNSANVVIDVDVALSVASAKEKLETILNREKQLNCELQINQFQKGFILLQLKRLTTSKKGFTLAIKNIMSYGHACKLIRFYNYCESYYNLRFTTLPFRNVISNIGELAELMQQDQQFWNPVKEQNPP